MSEKRFLSFVWIEGLILILLGLCVLILPKLTQISFGVMLSGVFIAYGIYKIINGAINRNYLWCYLMEILLGVHLSVVGVLLLLVPKINLLWIIALIGIYFLFENLSTSAFVSQIRKVYNFWGCKYVSGIIMFLIGLLIIVSLPAMSFWVVAMLCGIGFLIKGMSKISFYNANKGDV